MRWANHSTHRSTISTIESDFNRALQPQNQPSQNDSYNPDGTLRSSSLRGSRRKSKSSFFTDRSSLFQQDSYESPATSPTTLEGPGLANLRPTSPRGSVNTVTTDLIDLTDGEGSITSELDELDCASALDVLARASDLLSNCPERDSIPRPPVTLDWDPPHPKNLVPYSMHKRFLANARRVTEDRQIPTEDLLRTGIWWVLKVRDVRHVRRLLYCSKL